MEGTSKQIEPRYPLVLANNKPKTVAELFSRPSRWNKGHNARNAAGSSVDETAPCATNWCFLGGLRLVYGNDVAEEKVRVVMDYIHKHYALLVEDKDMSLTEFNDHDSIRFKDIRRIAIGAGV